MSFVIYSPKSFFHTQILNNEIWFYSTFAIICNFSVVTVLFSRRRQRHPTPVLLPGKSHGRRGLVGCSPGVAKSKESDTTEQLHFHFSLSCIGEGNGSPLRCSCLENPRDGGACWAAVYGVAQSQTRLKRLSSSSSRILFSTSYKAIKTPLLRSVCKFNSIFINGTLM